MTEAQIPQFTAVDRSRRFIGTLVNAAVPVAVLVASHALGASPTEAGFATGGVAAVIGGARQLQHFREEHPVGPDERRGLGESLGGGMRVLLGAAKWGVTMGGLAFFGERALQSEAVVRQIENVVNPLLTFIRNQTLPNPVEYLGHLTEQASQNPPNPDPAAVEKQQLLQKGNLTLVAVGGALGAAATALTARLLFKDQPPNK